MSDTSFRCFKVKDECGEYELAQGLLSQPQTLLAIISVVTKYLQTLLNATYVIMLDTFNNALKVQTPSMALCLGGLR